MRKRKRISTARIFMAVLLAAMACRATRAHARDLGDLLVERGIITKADLAELRREARHEAESAKGKHKKGTAETTTSTGMNVAPAPAMPPPTVAVAPQPAQPSPQDLDQLVKKEVASQLPPWLTHFKISTLLYMDWAYYINTGYGPQFLTQINPPGPGNDGFNSFDLTRAYINLFWKPSDDWTIRVTPNIYREVSTGGSVNTSQNSSVGTNVNGNLSYRLKYGYLQANNVWENMNVRMGQLENPLVAWEEDLYGYRFVNLTPLNYLAYSSTDLGIAVHGPVMVDGNKYADYWLGFYNGSSFHSAEFNEFRSPQGRVSLYPLASINELKNLGLTYFMSYGYTNVAPDSQDHVIRRLAALAHYNNDLWGIAGEYDQTTGENSFGNFFSGAAPPQNIPDPNDPSMMIPNPIAQVYSKILNPFAPGRGYAIFGHFNLWDSGLSLFGMWHHWNPNTDVSNNPLEFNRYVFGLAYRANSWLRVAVDSQNLWYVNSGPTVPVDTHAIFTNLEINY